MSSTAKGAATKRTAAQSTQKKTTTKPPAKAPALEPSDTLFYDPDPKRLRLFRLEGRTWLLTSDVMMLATGNPGNNTQTICAEPEDWREETVELEEGNRKRACKVRLVSLWGAHEYCVRLFTERSYALWRWIRQQVGEEAGA